MLRSRLITGTEQHFLNERLRHWRRFKTDLPIVMIPEIEQLYESAKINGCRAVGGCTSIYWNDLSPEPKRYSVDNTDYYSHDPECTSI